MERSRFEADSRLVEFCEVGGRLFTANQKKYGYQYEFRKA